MTENNTSKINKKRHYDLNPCSEMFHWDFLDSIILAVTVIWAGVVLIANNLDFVVDPWPLFFLGAGIFVLIEVMIRLLVPSFRKSMFGDLVWAGVLFWLGDWNWIWPMILVVIGASILIGAFRPTRLAVK